MCGIFQKYSVTNDTGHGISFLIDSDQQQKKQIIKTADRLNLQSPFYQVGCRYSTSTGWDYSLPGDTKRFQPASTCSSQIQFQVAL